jgi:hypothetical protein
MHRRGRPGGSTGRRRSRSDGTRLGDGDGTSRRIGRTHVAHGCSRRVRAPLRGRLRGPSRHPARRARRRHVPGGWCGRRPPRHGGRDGDGRRSNAQPGRARRRPRSDVDGGRRRRGHGDGRGHGRRRGRGGRRSRRLLHRRRLRRDDRRRCSHRSRRRNRGGRGRNGSPHGQVRNRVAVALRLGCDPDAEMHVRLAGLRVAARADRADHVALGDGRRGGDDDRAEMREGDREPVRGRDRDHPAGARDGSGERDGAGGRSANGVS